MIRKVLLLAGTFEARVLAGRLLDMPGIHVIASLAGVTKRPESIPAETRIGGFGGTEGLISWLRDSDITAVIDATHPFATVMPWNVKQAADALSLPRLRLLRPEWPLEAGWRRVASLEEAALALPAGARVFLSSGRQQLEPFAERADCWFLLRSIEPPDALPPHIRHLQGMPGKDYASEFAVFCSHRISHLVSKNSGGVRAKLDAAQGLGMEVVMVDRPPQPPSEIAETVPAAVAWLRQHVGFGDHDRKD